MQIQPTLWDSERQTFKDSLEQTIGSLEAYGRNYKHWAVAFSGGKDSSATVTVVAHLIETGRIPAPKSLTVLYADTRMELPPLQAAAMSIMAELERKGIKTQVVWPTLQDRFMVYMFGRGVPPPSNTFRWCTSQLKIEPMQAALKSLRDECGEKLLMLTGVRVGESAARDARISLSCSKNGAECGQGWFQETTPESIADTLAPLLHWRLCHVWDWLFFHAPDFGYQSTRMVAESYGGDEAREVAARTGCVGCNLASRDVALETLLQRDRWKYLEPLMDLRPLYAWLKLPMNRLRKHDERKNDGSLVANPGRMGPLTMEARREGMRRVIDIQDRCNAARGENPEIDLINKEEADEINRLIEANTWPNRWSGDEMRADTVMPEEVLRGMAELMNRR